MKVFEKRDDAVLGVFRALPDGTFRIEPVERRQPELTSTPNSAAARSTAIWSRSSRARPGRYGLPRAKVIAVLGSLTTRKGGLDDRHPRPRHPAYLSGDVHCRGRGGQAGRPWPAARTGANLPLVTIDPADAKDHDDAVYRRAGHRRAESRRRDRHRRHRRCRRLCARQASALDREALKRGNSVYFPDRVVPMLPERISNDLCSLKEGVDRPALAVRMTFSRRRPQDPPRFPPRHDALGGEACLSAGAGGDRRRSRTRRPGRSSTRVLKPLWASLRGAEARPQRRASRSNSTCPSGRSC